MIIKEYLENANFRGSEYLKYARNIYTQNGEDGIIEKILEELEIRQGLVMEFGAWDGIYLSNTLNLWRDKRFKCVLVEPDTDRFNEMIGITKNCDNVECFNSFIIPNSSDPNSVDSILDRSKFKDHEFVLLSIDVDSIDYHIFNSIERRHPIILIIETNTDYEPPIENTAGSCSIQSIFNLATSKGYTLVASTGNCIFIKNEFIGRLKNYNPDLTLSDYYINTEMVEKILQRIDESGEIGESYYYRSKEYTDILEKEKIFILNEK
jgi:hypothetical protein